MIAAVVLGVAWATYNFVITDGERGLQELQPLVWTIFATPFVLWIGWVVARRTELWLAAFSCFCLYFFTPFVAARLESLIMTPDQAAATRHEFYFQAVLVLHLLGGVGLAIWRARRPAWQARSAEAEQHSQQAESSPDAAR
jgi:hypothetical protein